MAHRPARFLCQREVASGTRLALFKPKWSPTGEILVRMDEAGEKSEGAATA
jgi:hypothetical protein